MNVQNIEESKYVPGMTAIFLLKKKIAVRSF